MAFHRPILSTLGVSDKPGAVHSLDLGGHADGIKDAAAAKGLADRHDGWAAGMPRDVADLWDFIAGLDHASVMALFAHCASLTVNALKLPRVHQPRAHRTADRLAAALTLDMSQHWAPTVSAYLDRVTKAHILDVVREAFSDEAANRIDTFSAAIFERRHYPSGVLLDIGTDNRINMYVQPDEFGGRMVGVVEVKPKRFRQTYGRYFEEFRVGDVYEHRPGRTLTENDNIWFSLLTNNQHPLHSDAAYGERSEFGQCLMDSCITLSVVTGLSVADVSAKAIANLGWTDVKLLAPVFAGDTIYAESEVLQARESKSRPTQGIVTVLTTGTNAKGVKVIEFKRVLLIPKRGHAVDDKIGY